MRELDMCEMAVVSGADGTQAFNQCMAENWAENTITGAIGGAAAGAFFGPGAFLGFVGGAVSGSTGTFGYCGLVGLWNAF